MPGAGHGAAPRTVVELQRQGGKVHKLAPGTWAKTKRFSGKKKSDAKKIVKKQSLSFWGGKE